MPTYFQRPENALKRANEFIDVGKKQRALDALYDVIKSKKHRTWQKIHEPIMEKYLELCVELRKSHIAKEGLYQYKNICQQVNIKSLEDVVRKYIGLAEQKTEEARQESHQVVIDVDDLEMPDTPESLLLKAVSGEDTQDRTDRAILTPWVKFLWESYRQCLDLLRNNSKVEKLYQDIAQQAFKFCLKYTRKTEFRKLCDNLRTHLTHVHRHQNQQTAINLNNPDSQAMHLETRLVQLDSAINMELWQEAFKAVEDIHGLIILSKKNPRPSLMANYYSKLGLVFWKSGNHLFHACTLTRLFHLSKDQRKNLSQEELQKMASRVLCATLAVPIPASRNAIDTLLEMGEETIEKQRRLATLLMLPSPPKRQSLVSDLAKHNLMQYVHPELKSLYNLLEVDFHPLRLYERVKECIKFISETDDLAQYVPALEDIIVTRVLKQVSQVYQSIDITRFASLVPFATSFRLERLIVNASRQLELQVRIDHRNHSLSFGTDLGVSQKEDVPEGPYIQRMPSEVIRMQLTHLAVALHQAVKTLQPREPNNLLTSMQNQKEEMRSQIINNYKLTAKKEHSKILQRKYIIEARKEELEHLNEEREREAYEQLEEQKRKAMKAEMERLEREAKERDRQRMMAEQQDIQRKHALERIEQLKKSELGARVVQNIDEEDLVKMDVDDIMAKQVEQLEKEKKDLQERLRNQEKKIDHMARARRMKELPYLEKQYEEERVVAREFWENQEKQRIEKLKQEHELEINTRDRMRRMKKDVHEFLTQLKDRRKKQYKEKLTSFEKRLVEERRERLAERKEQRKEERRSKYMKEKEEAEQKAKDEALLREREEKERAEREKRDAEEREYQEKLAKLEELANKQKQREREIEEREAKRREEAMRESRPVAPVREKEEGWKRGSSREDDRGGEGWRKGAPPDRDERDSSGPPSDKWRPSGGGWREREKEKHDSWKKDPERGERSERTERGPERGPADEERPRPSWREKREEPREERGGPPRGAREERDEPRGGGGGWRDRAPARRDDGPPARSFGDRDGVPTRDRRFDNRDIRLDKEEMSRLEETRSAVREERSGGGAWRRGGDREEGGWRGGDAPREAPARDAPARDAPRRDDRPPIRREEGGRGGDSWRGGGGGGSSWRDRERDREGGSASTGGGGGGSAWRRGGDDRAPPRDREEPRRAPPPEREWKKDAPPREKPRERPAGGEPDDGWTTVKR